MEINETAVEKKWLLALLRREAMSYMGLSQGCNL